MTAMHPSIKKAVVETIKSYDGNTVVMSGDAYKTMCLQFSALYEGACKEARELRQDNQLLQATIRIMSGYISDSLEAFERMFESCEDSLSYETMQDYVTIARFMGRYVNRAHIADRVEERMNSLPF